MKLSLQPQKTGLLFDDGVEVETFATAFFDDWLEREFDDYEFNNDKRTNALVALERLVVGGHFDKLPLLFNTGRHGIIPAYNILRRYADKTYLEAAWLINAGEEAIQCNESSRERLELGHNAMVMAEVMRQEIEVAIFRHEILQNDNLFPPSE